MQFVRPFTGAHLGLLHQIKAMGFEGAYSTLTEYLRLSSD